MQGSRNDEEIQFEMDQQQADEDDRDVIDVLQYSIENLNVSTSD